MEIFLMALEITVSLFAVIGVYSTVRLLGQRFFCSRNLLLTVEIQNEEDAQHAEELLEEALSQYLLVPNGRIAVLTTPALRAHRALCEATKRYGVPIRVAWGRDISEPE